MNKILFANFDSYDEASQQKHRFALRKLQTKAHQNGRDNGPQESHLVIMGCVGFTIRFAKLSHSRQKRCVFLCLAHHSMAFRVF